MRPPLLTLALSVVTVLALVLATGHADAQLTARSIAFGPFGGGLTDANGTATPLTSDALLVPAAGPDGTPQTADDVTLLVDDVARTPTVTPLATPFLFADSGASRVVRLSATRALVAAAGPDGIAETADDVVHLLDALGTSNTVTPLSIGFLGSASTWNPVRLADDLAVVVSSTDTLVVLRELGTTNTVTPLAAPGLRSQAGQPTVLGPTSLLLPAGGATADDLVYLFTDLGSTNARHELSTPHLSPSHGGRPTPLDTTRAMAISVGPDGVAGTTDDGVHLLHDLGTANDVTLISTGPLAGDGAGGATALSPDLVVLASPGTDGSMGTTDDLLILVSSIGSTNTLRGVPLAGLADGRAGRPVRLGTSALAVVTMGPDLAFDTTDDAVMVVTNVGTLNGLHRFALGGLGPGATTQVTVVNETTVMVAAGGDDATLAAGTDDVVHVISGIPRAPFLRSVPAIGDFDGPRDLHARPQVLGSNRAVFLSGGADATQGSGNDDLVRVVSGILPLPHFQCYDTRRSPFARVTVGLEDALGLGAGTLKRPRRLCTPSNKNREEPGLETDPRHLVGYQLQRFRPRVGRLREVVVTNQLGTVPVELSRPELLLVPAAKSPVAPPPPLDADLDHYKCYRTRGARARVRDVLLEDQFGSNLVDIKRPVRLCTPADKNGEGLFDGAQYLMCYEISARRLDPPSVFVDDQFGARALLPRRGRELCVPSLVTFP